MNKMCGSSSVTGANCDRTYLFWGTLCFVLFWTTGSFMSMWGMSITGWPMSTIGVEKNLREISDRANRAAGLNVFDSIIAMFLSQKSVTILADYLYWNFLWFWGFFQSLCWNTQQGKHRRGHLCYTQSIRRKSHRKRNASSHCPTKTGPAKFDFWDSG